MDYFNFINIGVLISFLDLFSKKVHLSSAKNLKINTTLTDGGRNEINKMSISDEMTLRFGIGEPTKEDIKFYVYSKPKNPDYAKEVTIGDLNSLKESGLVAGTKIHIVTHGFLRSIEGNVTNVKNAYLRENFKNIVLVDWSKLSTPTPNIEPINLFFYFQAKKNTRIVGQTIAEFIRFCKENSYADYDNFHLIGHSLGAHVMGIAGHDIYENTGKKVGRITGLDPAGPFYDGVHKKFKLSKDDARFVDAIHTDTDVLGTPNSVATADFYANGGLGDRQTICEGVGLLDASGCSHVAAFTYYINSILGQKYFGCKCKKAPNLIINTACPKPPRCPAPVLFGEFSSETIKGNYYVNVG